MEKWQLKELRAVDRQLTRGLHSVQTGTQTYELHQGLMVVAGR